MVHLLMILYCIYIHASRVADDKYDDDDMHIMFCIAIMIYDICCDESCIVYDTNRRLSGGNCLVWDSMPSLRAAVLILQDFIPFLRVQGAQV